MILSHKHKFIFICNGKTGTTSVEAALGTLDESCDMNHGAANLWATKHAPPAVIKAFLPRRVWDEYFKFVFVRHPYDWFVSQFKFNFKRPARRTIVTGFIRTPWRLGPLLSDFSAEVKRSEKQRFDTDDVDFLYNFLRRYRGLPGAPTLTQSNYVFDVDGKQLVDFVGHFETLHEDLAQVSDRIGVAVEVPHLNPSERAPWRDSLHEEARRRIRDLWRVDFESFDYEA